MNSTVENDSIVITLGKRIDTNNAPQVEQEIEQILKAHEGLAPAFDAVELEYISSVGLRILMKWCKATGKKLQVRNVSKDVFDIFETTGFTNILDVQKKMREISIEGCELIGSGGYGKVYRIDPETIAKIYLPQVSLEMVQKERDVAQKAFLAGVPTAISYDVVRCGDCYGVVFELLNAKTVAQHMAEDPSRVREMGIRSANLLRDLHKIEVKDNLIPNRKEEMLEWVENIKCILEPSEAEELSAFIRAIPDSDHFLHGDFNSKNIMVNGDEFLLIDIGDAAVGHPMFDVAGLLLPYVYLLNSPLPDDEKVRLLGFRLEDAPLMLKTMFATYFGYDESDEQQFGMRMQEANPYATMLAAYHGSRRTNFNEELMRKTTLPLIQGRLLPAVRQAKPINW